MRGTPPLNPLLERGVEDRLSTSTSVLLSATRRNDGAEFTRGGDTSCAGDPYPSAHSTIRTTTMENGIIYRFKQALEGRRQQLLRWIADEPEHVEIHLGGSTDREVEIVDEIAAALHQIEGGEFGKCSKCDGEVEVDRLQLDFTTQVCLDCYSADELRALERDLELAAGLQRQLFPAVVPALQTCEIVAHVRPAHIVGGDYYDFFPFSDNSQGFVLADVMGKGLSASMLMSHLQASLRILGPEYTEPDALAGRLNELFLHNVSVSRFISMFLMRLAPDESEFCYCNAGHHPGLLWKEATHSIQTLSPTGPALGLVREPQYHSRITAFEPGDVLLTYTDGLVEARNAGGAEFGEARLRALLEKHYSTRPQQLLNSVREEVERFSGGAAAHDDISVVIVSRRS